MDHYLSEIDNPTESGRASFEEALRTHRVTFAIEEARRRGQVVDPGDLPDPGQVPAKGPPTEPDQERSSP